MEIGDKVTEIPPMLFMSSGISAFVFPKNTKHIDNSVFSGAPIFSALIPNSVETISQGAFVSLGNWLRYIITSYHVLFKTKSTGWFSFDNDNEGQTNEYVLKEDKTYRIFRVHYDQWYPILRQYIKPSDVPSGFIAGIGSNLRGEPEAHSYHQQKKLTVFLPGIYCRPEIIQQYVSNPEYITYGLQDNTLKKDTVYDFLLTVADTPKHDSTVLIEDAITHEFNVPFPPVAATTGPAVLEW